MVLVTCRKFVSAFCALSLALVSFAVPVSDVKAQAVQDYDAPVIQHTPITEGVAGDIQSFDAVVFDNAELSSVTLYHREAGQDGFEKREMLFLEKDDYRVYLPTAADKEITIEYYIEAVDIGENKTIEGFPNLLQRKIIVPVESSVETPPVVAETPETLPNSDADESVADAFKEPEPVGSTIDQGEKKNNTVWWIVGGAVALGLVAALAGGGSDDDPVGGGGGGGGPGTVTFTLTPP